MAELIINIGDTDQNADWIKWRERKSELEIHRKIAEELAKGKTSED